jgi:cytochrome c oxidase subunit III
MEYKVGTATELPKIEENKPRRTKLGGGGGSGGSNGRRGGGGGSGGGGGGDRRDNEHDMEREQFVPAKYRLTMWFLLLVIMMTFAGLMGAYIVLAVNKQVEWQPFDLPFQVWISTLIILASSVTYEFAKFAINREDQTAFRRWLVVTAALGATFISSQLISWFALVQKGVYVASNPYAGFFYILTAVHALHLVGGIVALGYLVLKAWNPTRDAEKMFKRQTAASIVGLYWHSMDGLWLVLFALLALWK